MTQHPSAAGLLARRVAWVFAALLVVVAAADCALAQEEPAARAPASKPLSAAEIDVAQSLLNRVEAHWWRRKALLELGELEAAHNATENLLALLEQENVSRLPSLAEAALLEAQRAERAGNLAGGLEAYRLARKLDPAQADAAWGEASLLLGDGRYRQAAGPAWKALTARWKDFWTFYGDLLGLATWLGLALWLAGAAVVCTLLLRYGPTLAAAVGERLPVRWHRSLRGGFGWGVVLLPAMVLVLGLWAVFAWALMLVPAARGPERRFVVVWLLITALVVPAMGAIWLLTSAGASPAARVAVATAERSPRPDLLQELKKLSDTDPAEPAWRVMRAQLVGERHPDRAMALLREAQEVAPADPRVRIALGNVLFRAGKYEAATVRFREALEIDHENVTALYNLGKAHLAGFQFEEANEVLLRARQIDAERVARLEERTGENEVADPTFTVPEVASRVLGGEIGPGLRRALQPVNRITGVALAACLIAWYVGSRRGRIPVRRCRTCGQVMRSALDEAERKDVCRACGQLFSGREGLAPKAREEQRLRVDRYLARLTRGRRLAHVVWPGLALAHEGRPWAGWMLASLWSFLVMSVVWPARVLPAPAAAGPWPAGSPWLVVLVLVWLAAQLVPGLRPGPAGRRTEGS